MLAIQKAGRNKKIAGLKKDGSVEKIEGLHCARKHVIDRKEWSKIDKFKNFFTFVSSPKIYRQKKMLKRSKGWCHPFRNPDKKISSNAPKLLMPESDFMDPMFVCYKKSTTIKHDYFYFTINSDAGIKHKGLYQFIDMLPALCKCRLKGLIIVYFPNAGTYKKFIVDMSPERKKILKKYDHFLTYHWGLLKQHEVSEAMTSCRFGLFPNTVDNSPRLITESLIRNVPILVNNNIHGGWHYVNENTGSLFDMESIDKSISFIMQNKFNARDYFVQNYGFERSSKKLCDFLSRLFKYNDYTHMYFYDFRKYLKGIK